METAALLAPVTALEFLQETYLFCGAGPLLSVYSLQPRPKRCSSLSVLQQYRIHGMRLKCTAASSSQDFLPGTCSAVENVPSPSRQTDFYDLAVFGGKAVRLVKLHVDLEHENEHLETISPLVELQDWVLDVRWLSGAQSSLVCVAVAHNCTLLLDTTVGNILVKSSCVEGCLLYSALLVVHKSWEETVLVGGTVFNQLVIWKPSEVVTQKYSSEKAPVHRRLQGHTGVIFSISYLQQKGLLASASDDRSVRLWEVGLLGGAGGTCSHANPICLRVLYGHQARVFSVFLLPENVFSAGEDGACLLWDWTSAGKVVRTLKGHRAGGVRALAVSKGAGGQDRWVATGGADGGVRLWKVEGAEGLREEADESMTGKLVDLKLPSHVVPKVVCRAGGENEHESWSQSKFLACNEQGRVYQFSQGQWEKIFACGFELHSYCMMETTTVAIEDSTAKVVLCALGSFCGFVHVFSVSQPKLVQVLTTTPKKIHSLILQEARGDVYLLASDIDGLVFRWRIKVNLDENSDMYLTVDACRPFLLPSCAKRWLTAAVPVLTASQGVLWVCGDRRGSLLLYQEAEILGRDSQEGPKRPKDSPLHAVSRLFGVHGKQGVTSVRKHRGLLYSTGRDGCVRVLRICQTQEPITEESTAGFYLEVLRVQRACKGMEWLEGILFLEPNLTAKEDEEVDYGVKDQEEEAKEEDGDLFYIHYKTEKQSPEEGEERKRDENKTSTVRETRFVILGFQGVLFVIWDPLRRERLLAVPCGGGHRSWALWPSSEGVWRDKAAVVFIKQGSILASQPPLEATTSGGEAQSAGGMSLREGVHGRGIACVCRLGKVGSRETRVTATKWWEVAVTGGEDTSLAVVAIHPSTGAVSILSVITDHISSIRTLAAVADRSEGAPPGTLSALLVSAGGRAQMQCYRLLVSWDRQRREPSCQVIQVAAHRLDEHWEKRRDRHKIVKMDAETRYMCITVLDEKPDCLLLALACSDGALRFFSVHESSRQINFLWETFHHQRCVLSVASCSLEDRTGRRYKLLFSAATDGKIAVWNLTDACGSSTDGWSSAAAPPIPCLNIPAHQSGVNSLVAWTESLEQHEDGCLVTVASGGDDGQLTVTAFRVRYPQGGSQLPKSSIPQQTQFQHSDRLSLQGHRQVRVPLAHAAPLTALKLLRSGLLVSTSADQRVCLWRVSNSSISQCGALCSHVADTAGLAVWEEESVPRNETADMAARTGGSAAGCTGQTKGREPGWVLVCGQGFQLLQVRTTDELKEEPTW